MIFISKKLIINSLSKIMSNTERRRFIVTGGPRREQYGLTPRSTRGFEPGGYGSYGETRFGSRQQQETRTGASAVFETRQADASPLPTALEDLQTWMDNNTEAMVDTAPISTPTPNIS